MSLPSLRNELHLFPKLIEASNFFFKSKFDQSYNCIAWAIIRNNIWVDAVEGNFDGIFWPDNIQKGYTYNHLIELFQNYEYVKCGSSSFEDGFMKVALYGDNQKWTHASRQLPNGNWTSKMGILEDIEHLTPHDLEGQGYGSVFQIMKRPNSSYKSKTI